MGGREPGSARQQKTEKIAHCHSLGKLSRLGRRVVVLAVTSPGE